MNPFWRYKLDHVLFWTVTVLFHMYTRWALIDHLGTSPFVMEVIVRNGLLAGLIYLNLYVLIPRFAKTGRWFTYGTLLIGAMLFYTLLKDVHDSFLTSTTSIETNSRFLNQTFYNISIAVFYVAFSVALELSREWSRQRDLLRQIAFDQVDAELAYLKAQINPHFLFNSINTIYFQIDKENRTAREMLAAFSDMLRYQLYECNGSRIAIEKEVAYLRNYVDLQRMRKDGNYSIKFSADPNVTGFQIAPLLLMPFVENAFKHVSHAQDANKIEIALSYASPKFQLLVYNTREPGVGKGTGIGLRNVKRRLELLYAGGHTLTIDDARSSFHVQLEVLVGAHLEGVYSTGGQYESATQKINRISQ
ncbi:MAG TPA: histidine kinase [Chryseolinea sp.]|nr:histidine kinase [Chryseolinea sp.]